MLPGSSRRCNNGDVPYDPTDPRSKLASAGSPASSAGGVPRSATYRELDATPPDEQHPNGGRTWWTRSQAMVIAQTAAAPGESLTVETSGEYAAILIDGAAASIEHAAGGVRTVEPSVVIVPDRLESSNR